MPADRSEPSINVAAAVLAWLWPGLGHIYIGERRRGRLIMFGILFLFFAGLLIGGIDSVDRREDYLWFLAQMLCGPLTFAADLINQLYLKGLPADQRLLTVGLNKPNEMGTLFIALAGLMNLVVILDALHFTPKGSGDAPAPERRREERGSA